MENHSEVVSRKCPQKSVESLVHQQDRYAGVGSSEGGVTGVGGSEGGVKGLGDLYRKAWDCKLSKQLSYKGVVLEEDDGLLEGGVIAIAGGGDDRLVEDRVSQDVDQQDFLLGDREAEEVNGDFVGRGVRDRGHVEIGRTMTEEHLISLPARVVWAVIRMLPHVLPIRGSVL